jgi:hypothetical protein
MTRAREALADCEHALVDFEAGANTDYQRTRWVALISLLRAVGHALDKVDRPASSPDVQRLIDAQWSILKSESIFKDFIYGERNRLLKKYEIGPVVSITIKVPGGIPWMPVVRDERLRGTARTTYDFVMRDGLYKGRDPRELCREAIEFWRAHLDAIDSGAAQ